MRAERLMTYRGDDLSEGDYRTRCRGSPRDSFIAVLKVAVDTSIASLKHGGMRRQTSRQKTPDAVIGIQRQANIG